MTAIHIDWLALGRVAGLSILIGVAIVGAFTVGVLGLARVDNAEGHTAPAQRATGYLLVTVTHGLCIAAVLYGLYLIVPQFH